jgi:hypothetical protein
MPSSDACSQRDTAAAHSGAAWERLKDTFTLSDSNVEIIDSESSVGHKFKVGWNNGAPPPQQSLRRLKRAAVQAFEAFVIRCGEFLKSEK